MWCLYMHLMPIMFGYDTQRQPMMFDTTNVKPGRTCIQVPYSVTTPVPSLILWKRAARTFCETFLLLYPDIQVWNDSFDSCIKLNVSEAVTCGDISDVLVMYRDVVVFCRRAAVMRVFAFLTRFPWAHGRVQCLQLWVKTQTVQRHTHLWNNLVDRNEKWPHHEERRDI